MALAVLQGTALAAAPPKSVDAPAITADEKKQIIGGIIRKMRETYVFPQVADKVERALRAAERRGEYSLITEGEAFASKLTADLFAVTNDKHLGVSYSAEPLPPLGAAKARDPAAMERWRASAARRNFAIPAVQVLPGNVGYIKLTNFLPAQFAGETLAAAMRFVSNTDALVLDLRDNRGGDPNMVALLLSYLVPPNTHLNDFYTRVDQTTTQVWSLPVVPGGAYGTERPVYVLTNGTTISAAEEVAYDLKQLKRGLVVGQQTAGGANPGGSVPLNSHFAIFIPVGRAINPLTKTNWEGVGVSPDIVAEAGRELEVAHGHALRQLASAAADPERKDELRKVLENGL
ncbi:MAG TPA: S41 family peptidase [Allosphingosinicella sp.]|jgi:hypothetical protein